MVAGTLRVKAYNNRALSKYVRLFIFRLMPTLTIISGGQTGADRAALDFAIAHDIPHGGWCPRGRMAEDGTLEDRYHLKETPSRQYAERTEWNIRDSDATVVFSSNREVTGGTALTLGLARRMGKPVLHLVRAEIEVAAAELSRFLCKHNVRKLNVAGPRASQESQLGEFVIAVLSAALAKRPRKGAKLHEREEVGR